MNSKFIIIIIPVYNAVKYLITSIDSILNQTDIHFKLLLIDDVSSDESLRLCNEFKEKDDGVKVINVKCKTYEI